jgi:catechol 2,3-dioxygenase-like lactoylglutathione lyase family enzyme
MRHLVSNVSLFAAGIVLGILLMQPGAAQQNQNPGLRLNHVGIFVKDFDESMRFYTQVVGLREAFTIRDNENRPTLAYLQVNRDTFIEIAPSNAQRPVGLSHIGIWPNDLNATVGALRGRGAKVDDPRTGATKTTITNVVDPNGVRLELLDFLPESAPAKAIASWK